MTNAAKPRAKPREERIRELLGTIREEAGTINTTPAGHGPSQSRLNNEERQGGILLAWEELAHLTGHTGLAGEKGFENVNRHPGWDGDPDVLVRKALKSMLKAADDLTTGPDDEAGETRDEFATRTALRQEEIRDALECIRRSTGLGDPDPIVPLGELGNVLEAMGVALFHVGSATLDYEMISDRPREASVRERFRSGEESARIAHRVLHHINESSFTYLHPLRLGPEFRKYARMTKFWLTTERAKAAAAMGLEGIPEPTDDLHAAELDGPWQETDEATR